MTEMNLEVKVSFSDFVCTCVSWNCIIAPVFPVICENFSGTKKMHPSKFCFDNKFMGSQFSDICFAL